MYFDPLSAWLVALIGNGISLANEITSGNSTLAERDCERAKQSNLELNIAIRREKKQFGLATPESSYTRIQYLIQRFQQHTEFKYGNATIQIDLDNQEYLIALLEACSERYSKYSSEQYRQKAAWFNNAAIEAKRRKAQYAKTLEEAELKNKQTKQDDDATIILKSVLGIVVIVLAFAICLFGDIGKLGMAILMLGAAAICYLLLRNHLRFL